MSFFELLLGPPDIPKLAAKAASTGDFSKLGAAAIHPNPETRLQAVSALATLAGKEVGKESGARLAALLIPCLKDSVPSVRVAAVQGLAHLHGMAPTHAPLRTALRDPDPGVREAAVRAWKGMRHEAAVAGWERETVLALGWLVQDSTEIVRAAAQELWAGLPDHGAGLFKDVSDPAMLKLQAMLRKHGLLPPAAPPSAEEQRAQEEERRRRYQAGLRERQTKEPSKSSAWDTPLLPLEGNESLAELVERLAVYYRRRPGGFIPGVRWPEIDDIHRIGSILDQRGGMELMRQAHADFVASCNLPGAARNLEILWHGIGRWQG